MRVANDIIFVALNPPSPFVTVTKHSGHTGPVTVVVSPLISLMEDQVRDGVMVDNQTLDWTPLYCFDAVWAEGRGYY